MRVLLIFPGALGDLLLLVPAAAALAARGCRVELSAQRALGPLVSPVFAIGPPVDGAAMSTLFTTALDPTLAAWLRGADRVHAWLGHRGAAGLDRHAGALGIRAVRCHVVERDDGPVHASLAYGAMLEVGDRLGMPVLRVPSGASADPWHAPPATRLLVHPGAGSTAKRWTPSGFRRVADCWRSDGGEVVLLLGPAEEGMVDFWRAAGHRVATGLDLVDAARVIAGAPAYLGNDSGISHLAGALDRSGAVLFGPTRPERWRPLGGTLTPVRFSSVSEAALADSLVRCLGRVA
ncbi:MAG: glycosyltransferase family 9 protein [Candidatus Binatia bacterium]